FRRRWRETAYSRCTSHPFSRVVMTFLQQECIINTLRKSNSDLVDLTCKRSGVIAGVIDHDKFIKMLYIGDYLVYNIVCV
ncbi:TPA: hypothetical protein ACGO53_002328, partial [Streptococcus suis]